MGIINYTTINNNYIPNFSFHINRTVKRTVNRTVKRTVNRTVNSQRHAARYPDRPVLCTVVLRSAKTGKNTITVSVQVVQVTIRIIGVKNLQT